MKETYGIDLAAIAKGPNDWDIQPHPEIPGNNDEDGGDDDDPWAGSVSYTHLDVYKRQVPDRGEVITSPTTLQAFEPITGSQNSGWGILQRIYDGGWRLSLIHI